MEQEVKKRVADFFESWELAEFLRIPAEEFVEAFEDEIENSLEDIEELMGLRENDQGSLFDRESAE